MKPEQDKLNKTGTTANTGLGNKDKGKQQIPQGQNKGGFGQGQGQTRQDQWGGNKGNIGTDKDDRRG